MTAGLPEIRPAFATRNIPVAFATDENYLPYVAVAINSLVANARGGNLDVLVFHAGIGETARGWLLKEVRKGACISVRFVDIGDVVRETAAGCFVQKNYLSVTTLFRLFIPRVLVAYERLVYLDVDLVVCQDISELYATDLAGCLFGAVRDYGAANLMRSSPSHREFAEKHGFSEWDEYVNAGVLLMDLAALRAADLLDRLLPVAVDAAGFSCDQDALNIICRGRICHLDPKWNVLALPASYEAQVREAGGQLGIVHFVSGEKPWKCPSHLCAHLWWSYAADLDFAVSLWRGIFDGGNDAVKCGEGIAVTVVVPVYNAERYLFGTLASLSAQPLRNIEVICVDDGSIDGSRAIVKTMQGLDPRVKLLSQCRQGPGTARNAALDIAAGEYVYFLDADDRIVPGDALLRAYEQARRNGLDMLLAASSTIAEDGHVLQTDVGLNREVLPGEEVFAPDALGAELFLCVPLGPCGKLYRRAFLEENELRFPALKRSEDFPMVGLALALSSRIGVLAQSVYERRIGVSSSLESTKDETPLIFFEAEQLLRDSLKRHKLWSRFKTAVYSAFVSRLVYNLQAVRRYSSFRTIIAKYRKECQEWIRWKHVALPERFADKVQLVKDISQGMDDDDQIALFVKLKEAAAANASDAKKSIRFDDKRLVALAATVEKVRAARDDALRMRDEALATVEKVKTGRDDALRMRDEALATVEKVKAGRDDALRMRDNALATVEKMKSARDDALRMRDEALATVGKVKVGRDDALRMRDNALATVEKMKSARDDALRMRDEALATVEKVKAGRDDALRIRDNALATVEKTKSARDDALRMRDGALATVEKVKAGRDDALRMRDEALATVEKVKVGRDDALRMRDNALATVEKMKSARDDALRMRDGALATVEKVKAGRDDALRMRDNALATLEKVKASRDALQSSLDSMKVTLKNVIRSRDDAVRARDAARLGMREAGNAMRGASLSLEAIRQVVENADVQVKR